MWMLFLVLTFDVRTKSIREVLTQKTQT